MILLDRLDAPVQLSPPLFLTIGNFDGLHRGHKRILRKVMARAREEGGTSALVTFEPHPLKVLRPDQAPALILTPAQKRGLLSRLGLQALVEVPFTRERAAQPAALFLQELCATLSPKEIYIGDDFRFGSGRKGDLALLRAMGQELGVMAFGVPKVQVDNADVSSTRIRTLLSTGQVDSAARLLGRPYILEGEVQHGDGRGATLGFPTANIATSNELLPALGVYAVALDAGGAHLLPGVANLGRRPTFGKEEVTLEVHLLKGGRDLYGETVSVYFFRHLRPERKFPSVNALKEAIASDASKATQALESVGLVRRMYC